MNTTETPSPGSLHPDCYATGRGWADGYKDGKANKYQPQCCIYGLGTPERDRWREAYERGWNAGNEKWHNDEAERSGGKLRSASTTTEEKP